MDHKTKNLTDRFKAVSRTRIYEEIASQIKSLIDNGGLKSGDQLPPERELAAAFNVSRHSVREAIRCLEKENVLKSRAGSGTFVMLGNTQAVADHLARAVVLEKDRLAEIFQIRVMLEPQVAALAAENASRDDIGHLADLYSQQLTAESRQVLIKLDQDFHMALAKSTGNKALCGIIRGMNDLLSQTRLEGSGNTERTQKSLAWHGMIVQAVAAGNPEQAEKAMREHLIHVRDIVLQRDKSSGGGE
jgi:GntR family transcriptional repressor for pyruvate dehydrogenase complex